MVLPGLGSKCAPGLFCASDLAGSEHQILLPAVVPGGSPNRGTNNHLHFSSLPEFLSWGCAGGRAGSVCAGAAQRLPCVPPHTACPAPDLGALRAMSSSPGQVWGKLLCQQMEWVGVLHLPRDQEYYRQWQPQLLTRPCQRNPVSE